MFRPKELVEDQRAIVHEGVHSTELLKQLDADANAQELYSAKSLVDYFCVHLPELTLGST